MAPEDDEVQVQDDSEGEVVPYRYSITSYGADYPVESLVNRLERDVIFVPEFQRGYVWTQKMASRFVESLLLGLPVPGIFLSKEPDTGRMLVIDGQQRLRTLQFYYRGSFGGRDFRLTEVQPQFDGRTYKTLAEEDRLRLDDSIIHATIVRQDEPSEDESSVFHIFERLNSGGKQLQPQEIRACIYHGEFSALLRELNSHPAWRDVYGPPSKRLKDQELILRFLALHYYLDTYERPMKEFLNRFMAHNRHLQMFDAGTLRLRFTGPIDLIAGVLGARAFRPERALNASVFDAVMLGIAARLDGGAIRKPAGVPKAYGALLRNEDFVAATQTGTSDVPVVRRRAALAIEAFSAVQ